jgi:hypothetical protein
MKNLAKKYTEQQLSDMWFNMETIALECMSAEGLDSSQVTIWQQKNKSGNTIKGLYYLVGNERNEKGLPTKIYFKKDFR